MYKIYVYIQNMYLCIPPMLLYILKTNVYMHTYTKIAKKNTAHEWKNCTPNATNFVAFGVTYTKTPPRRLYIYKKQMRIHAYMYLLAGHMYFAQATHMCAIYNIPQQFVHQQTSYLCVCALEF